MIEKVTQAESKIHSTPNFIEIPQKLTDLQIEHKNSRQTDRQSSILDNNMWVYLKPLRVLVYIGTNLIYPCVWDKDSFHIPIAVYKSRKYLI